MLFVFVDETGDPGADVAKGASAHFGMALLSVRDEDYRVVRLLLSQVHWLRGVATPMELPRTYNKSLDFMRGLKELARHGIVACSGLYLDKADYGGRYLRWSDTSASETEWPYYLRNYLLRHLLQLHFSKNDADGHSVDLVLDRVNLTERQTQNTHAYLNGNPGKPLRESLCDAPN